MFFYARSPKNAAGLYMPIRSVGIIKERRYAAVKKKRKKKGSRVLITCTLPLPPFSFSFSLSLHLLKSLQEHRHRTPNDRVPQTKTAHLRRSTLQPRPPRARRRRRTPRLLRGVHKRVARHRTRLAIRARRGNQLDAANLAAAGGIRGQKRPAAAVRLGAHLASGGRELRRGCNDACAPRGVGGCADDGGAVLGGGDGGAGGVCADDGYGDRGGRLGEDGGCLDDGLALGVGGGLRDGDDDGAVGGGCFGGRRVGSWRCGAAFGGGEGGGWGWWGGGGAVGGDLALLEVLDGGDDEFGCEGWVRVVHLFDAAVVGFEDALLEVFEAAESGLEGLFGEGVEQVVEGFLRARVDGVGLRCVLGRRCRLLCKHGAEERQGQNSQSAEGKHDDVRSMRLTDPVKKRSDREVELFQRRGIDQLYAETRISKSSCRQPRMP